MKPRALMLALAAALLGTLLLGSRGFEMEHGASAAPAEPAARGGPVLVRLILGMAS